MQLNKFTDYALRILMYVAIERQKPYTIVELAKALQVSENHAIKIVHFMAKQQWIITMRGKGGGIRLSPATLQLRLGEIVRRLEGNRAVVECHQPPCILRNHCELKGILQQAMQQFYAYLDQYQLADVQPKSHQIFAQHTAIELIHLT